MAVFRPVRGKEEKILNMAYNEGYFYVATDTGNMYVDASDTNKIPLGGRGASILYAKGEARLSPSQDDVYFLNISSLEDPDIRVKAEDLIINQGDAFYRVEEVDSSKGILICSKVAAGTGGGSSGGENALDRGEVKTSRIEGDSDILNGSTCKFSVLATSATEKGKPDEPIDSELKLTITFAIQIDTNHTQDFYTETFTVQHNVPFIYDATPYLRDSTSMVITFKVTGSESNLFKNSGKSQEFITTHDLFVEWVSSQFSSNKFFTDSINTSIHFATGARRTLDVYFDDYLIYTKIFEKSVNTADVSPAISANSKIYNKDGSETGLTLGAAYSHGRHIIKAQLSLTKATNERGSSTDPITKEIALYLDEGFPLIWFGDMQSTYYEYDAPNVPIRAYDPRAGVNGIEVYCYIDGANALENSYFTMSNDSSEFLNWTLTDLTAGQTTLYQVRVGEGEYEKWETVPEFQVLEDPRNMGVAQTSLKINFDARGRSNAESAQKRSIVKIGNDQATLTGFNWYNNGWIQETGEATCLRISNGASVSFPIGRMSFGGTISSHTIEMRLRIRNVQQYGKLITNYTRYKVVSDPSDSNINKNWSDQDMFDAFLAQRPTGYTSYDAYLAALLPKMRETDPTVPTYEDLEYDHLERSYDLKSAMAKYITTESNPKESTAICLGPQDGYFSNGANAVTVDYVEDEILNLTIVYNHGDGSSSGDNKLMKFYLNGMLTSVARSSKSSWDIGANNFVLSSDGCDIDLFKFRVYDRALGLQEILKNVAYDDTDTTAWDLAELYTVNQTIDENYQFSYNKMIEYNKEHPNKQIMPYIVFTTDDSNVTTKGKLPWRKSISVTADMEFINPYLDRAYDTGALETAAKAAKDDKGNPQTVEYYYLHHCPSWIAEGVTLSVQGTSSEFYPRRNYKAKTKVKVPKVDENGSTSTDEFGDIVTSTEYTMKLHKGPYKEAYDAGKAKAQKFFYYDNDTVGTNKFTLKIDYMESSGTYNMGLANLVNTAYSHHPLRDYNSSKAFGKGVAGKEEELKAYPSNGLCWYRNHKGNWKCAKISDDNNVSIAKITEVYGDLIPDPSNILGDIKVENAADFATGPWDLAVAQGQTKVLGGDKKSIPAKDNLDGIIANINKNSEDNGTYENHLKDYIDKFYNYTPGSMEVTTIGHLSDYRTSVQGFPTLAFLQTKSGAKNGTEPQFIGRYNMLLDKGAAEAYGFALNSSIKQNYIEGNPAVIDIAECWEFENNSRGYCSFRDPWNRRELSFKAPVGDSSEFTANGAPIIADSFEYRYNANDDYIDMLYNMNSSFENSNTVKKLQKQFPGEITDKESGCNKLLDIYSNWEKAVAWVWSTATDAIIDGEPVPLLGTYNQITLYEYMFEPNKYYVEEIQENKTVYTLAPEYKEGVTYYIRSTETSGGSSQYVYTGVTVTDNKDLLYKAKTYYTLENGVYVQADGAFDASAVYYKLTEDESAIGEQWKLTAPVTYNGKTYNYDTQEYRIAKFKNEVTKHFNLEYLITYFVITEVLECYDSRGKNAMFASWGPQEQGGDYIWYPIFYDMDTQLGINNTGIPSFEYNIDATDDGTFSTNDSVLWDNVYSSFRNLIIDKYQQLRGEESTNFEKTLTKPPFISVDMIDSWYTCDPAFTNSYSMMGLRPLMALNLDEQFKYISITNPKVGYPDQDGTFKTGNDNYFYALQGNRAMSRRQFLTNRLNYIDSWFTVGNYMRGGSNRIRSRISANNSANTSDRWITGTTTNGDNNLETMIPYYHEDGTKTKIDDYETDKTHLFDGEYWITMTPVRNMYVTVGTDTANFPSLKYSGTPVQFTTTDLEKGVKASGNYREQLYYVYGLDQMKSLGDLSRLYFQEFELSGNAKKMTDLRLGYDGIDESGNHYKNSGVNDWSIPAGKVKNDANAGMPLLKEVNLSYITFKNNNLTFDFSSCEKLENFRDIGSNIVEVKFAEGVALNTLHLSSSTSSLELIEARKLTDLITKYEVPKVKSDGTLAATPGLYIEGLTDSDSPTTSLTTLNIQGGNLGYNSYTLLEKYVVACDKAPNTERKINLTSVQWSPYIKVDDPELTFSADGNYYKDNGHFGLEPYTVNDGNWKQLLANGQIYRYAPSEVNGTSIDSDTGVIKNITSTEILQKLIDQNNYHNTSSDINNNAIPNITGCIYIENATSVDEGEVQTKLASKYPGLTFFFKNIDKGYAARFIILEDGIETLIGTDKISRSNKDKFFANPLTRGATETAFSPSRINASKPSKDFLGWSTTNNRDGLLETYDDLTVPLGIISVHNWGTQSLVEDQYDYTFYGVFEDHHWDIKFYFVQNDGSTVPITYKNSTGNETSLDYQAVHGTTLKEPEVSLVRNDEKDLPLKERYRFLGFTRKINGNNIFSSANMAPLVDFTKVIATANMNFYAAWVKESVYDSTLDEKYFMAIGEERGGVPKTSGFNQSPIIIPSGGVVLRLREGVNVAGKITLPTEYKGYPVYGISRFANQPELTHVFWKGDPHLIATWTGSSSNSSYAAFYNDVALEYFEMPSTLEFIDKSSFSTTKVDPVTSGLAELTKLKFIGPTAFSNNSGVTTLTIPGSVTEIGGSAFAYGSGIKGPLTLGGKGDPTQLTTLGVSAFWGNDVSMGQFWFTEVTVYYNGDSNRLTTLQQMFNNDNLWGPHFPNNITYLNA